MKLFPRVRRDEMEIGRFYASRLSPPRVPHEIWILKFRKIVAKRRRNDSYRFLPLRFAAESPSHDPELVLMSHRAP